MRLKKIILILLLFITGCSAEYTISINDNQSIDESIVILQPNSFWGNNKEEINEQLEWSLVFAEDETETAYFYKHEKVLNNLESGLKYSYNFDKNNFISDSEFIKNCFDSFNFFLIDDSLNISASGFKCNSALGEDYSLLINIVTDGEVVDGNYERNNKNKYTWAFSEEDDDISIYLKMDLTKATTIAEYYEQNKIYLFMIIGIIVLLGGILLFAYIQNRKNNS